MTIIPKVIPPKINIEKEDVRRYPKTVARMTKRVIAFNLAGGSIEVWAIFRECSLYSSVRRDLPPKKVDLWSLRVLIYMVIYKLL